jgi:hypothetical protein
MNNEELTEVFTEESVNATQKEQLKVCINI